MSSKFLSLPSEILIEVLFRLPFQDLISCSRTCLRLHALFSETPLLQYVTYAYRAGVVDRFPAGLTVPDRFAALRRWEAAWGRSLDALAPSGGSVALRRRPHMKTACMLREGFLVAACFKDESADEEKAGYAAIDLLDGSADGAWTEMRFEEDVVALDVSVAMNLVAMLHVCVRSYCFTVRRRALTMHFRRELDGKIELLLDLLPFFEEEGPDGRIPDLGHIVSDGPFSRRKVELKIAGEFIAVMACGELPGDTDSFTLVDWRAGSGNNVSAHVHYPAFNVSSHPQVLSCPAHTYSPSFCFIDHETVAHVNLLDNTIETRKILFASDGDIYLQRFRKFNLPLSPTHTCHLVDARWSGAYPPMDPPNSHTSRLPFQSLLESSIVALTLSYAIDASHAPRDQRAFRAIIPRAKLLTGEWDTSSYRLFTLACHAPACSSWTGGCAIAGTRWINQCLQIFDFNKSRVRAVQAPTDVPAGPGFFERDVKSALPFCHAFPKNQFGDVFDGVLADDERVVAFRYKVSERASV